MIRFNENEEAEWKALYEQEKSHQAAVLQIEARRRVLVAGLFVRVVQQEPWKVVRMGNGWVLKPTNGSTEGYLEDFARAVLRLRHHDIFWVDLGDGLSLTVHVDDGEFYVAFDSSMKKPESTAGRVLALEAQIDMDEWLTAAVTERTAELDHVAQNAIEEKSRMLDTLGRLTTKKSPMKSAE